jgi:ESCRT-II complex subunit VPS22
LKSQLEVFKKSLEEFAHKHQKDIKKNPMLRGHFQKMCSSIGVDPLVSSKGFWADMLGVGDFYYELGIQIVESCLVVQEQTGGLTDLDILKKRIARLRTRTAAEVSEYLIVI